MVCVSNGYFNLRLNTSASVIGHFMNSHALFATLGRILFFFFKALIPTPSCKAVDLYISPVANLQSAVACLVPWMPEVSRGPLRDLLLKAGRDIRDLKQRELERQRRRRNREKTC